MANQPPKSGGGHRPKPPPNSPQPQPPPPSAPSNQEISGIPQGPAISHLQSALFPDAEIRRVSTEDTQPKPRYQIARADGAAPLSYHETTSDGTHISYHLAAQLQTDHAARIINEVVPEILELFIRKSNRYGEPTADDLGTPGQYADMHRKWKMLRGPLWEGRPLPGLGEPIEEILMDFAGHIFKCLLFMREER